MAGALVSKQIVVFLTMTVVIVFHTSFLMEREIDRKVPRNFFKVSDDLYRSAQLNRREAETLERAGVKTVINMRTMHNDKAETRNANLDLIHIRIRTGKMSEENVIKILEAFNQAKKPVLIHCWHGSDRTGVIVAAYRVVYQNWSKERAISEMCEGRFGYHERWFPQLKQLITDLNIHKVKSKLGLLH